MNKKHVSMSFTALLATVLMFAVGCAPSTHKLSDAAPPTDEQLQDLRGRAPIFDASGNRKTWNDLLAATDHADVIILGETHDDATGHALQQAFFNDALERRPGTTLSMEMLDRSEQAAVDDYLAGIGGKESFYAGISSGNARKIARSYLSGEINRATFEKRIFSLGWPAWESNYQPMIDAGKKNGARVIASNTPWLRYTSIANKKGLTELRTLTPAQQALVEVPPMLPAGEYRKRFFDLMSGFANHSNDDDAHGGGMDEDMILGMYRAQCVMDATMAASIVDHLNTHGGPVVHLVGQFHSDFNGGLIEQLRFMKPDVRVYNVSLQPVAAEELRDEDRSRADMIVYTGSLNSM